MEIHGSRGASLNDYNVDGQKKTFFRFLLWGEWYGKIDATSVFVSTMPMIFIFGFAKKDLLEPKLRLCKVREE